MAGAQFKGNTRKGVAVRHKSQDRFLLRAHLFCYGRSAVDLTWKVLQMPLIYMGDMASAWHVDPYSQKVTLKELSVSLTHWDNDVSSDDQPSLVGEMKWSKILDAAFELWGQPNNLVRACGFGTTGIPPLPKYPFLSPVREPVFSSAANNELAKALWIRERWRFKLLSLISSWSTLSFSLVHFSSPFLLKEFWLFSVFK